MPLPFWRAGRTALIAGASSGIGAHFAELFARAGANVVLGARRTDRTVVLAAKIGTNTLAVAMDVTDEASVIAAYDGAEARFGTVDTITAKARTNASGRSTEVTGAGVRNVIDTNFLGVYLTAREGAKRLIARGSKQRENGRIITIGSITAITTGHGDSDYAASKAAVAHLSRSFAREWVRSGINVNLVQPGYIGTELTGAWFAGDGGKAHIAGFHRRLLGTDALDDMMLYLSSDASRGVTGATITIGDGQSL